MSDKSFKQIADIYAEQYGGELRAEMEQLEQHSAGFAPSEARVAQRVRARIAADKTSKAKKRRPYYYGAVSVLAASFLIAFIFIIPFLSRYEEEPSSSGNSISAPTDGDTADSPSSDDATPDEATPEMPVFDIIPLAAPLPDGFTQAGFEQDYGQSIYYIEDEYMDDVIAVLEKTDEFVVSTNLTEIVLGDYIAYGTQTDAYSLLTYRIDDVQYTFTCRHDINTLIRLGLAFV